MKMRMMAAGILAMAVSAQAAVIAPEKRYAKPNEDVVVKFLNETPEGKKAIEKIGLAAVELDGQFKPADRAEVWNGGPQFSLYTFDGTKLEPTAIKIEWSEDGGLPLSAVFPQIKEAGTYLLVWKDATPLVIQTLRNPIPWSMVMDAPGRGEAIQKQLKAQPPVVTHMSLLEHALITTDKGPIKVKFAYDMAPRTVDNFITLAREKFYDGTAFHRIIKGFMIQGGCPNSKSGARGMPGTGGPGHTIKAEFNTKPHVRGVISMARSAHPDSAGCQFFICHGDARFLDRQYTAFGELVEGDDVLELIASTPASGPERSTPVGRVEIESITIQ